ncbi:DUF87 domain-containing protein [Sorangium sp. So ce726]|uniref:helicase HerA domain-containing protein n=1 Tax=Sorangium sp. So ce726 TaxID=3133319 RepID=UPI003F5FE034
MHHERADPTPGPKRPSEPHPLPLRRLYQLDLSDYARTGLRVGIWASSGRGKSFGVGVLCEELLAAGIPVVAIDPEGELYTLRERFRALVLGGAHADLPLPSGERAAEIALARVLDEGLGLIVDLSDQPTNRSQQEAALPFLERLWVLLSERRAPAAVVIEEVHIFAPQSGASLTSELLHRFAKQGRKRGVLLVVASQRTQAVSKELMSQLNLAARRCRPSCASSRKRRSGGSSPASRARTALHRRSSVYAAAARR